MATETRRGLNDAITRFWSVAAPLYDQQLLQRLVYRPAQNEVVDRLRTHGARRIADIACGTGILTDRIQRELGPDEIYGVDMSDGMLEQAHARSAKVDWRKGPAERLPFEDGALDAVVTTSAFHFFDQPAALREFHRVLAPGGLVAVTTINPNLPAPFDRLTLGRRSPAHNPSPAQMRTLFTDAGFTLVDQHRVRRPGWTQLVSDMITVGGR